jgi:hypothetical protein
LNRTILILPAVAAVLLMAMALSTQPVMMAKTNKATSSTNANATMINLTNYTDPQGQFSVSYPSYWTQRTVNMTDGTNAALFVDPQLHIAVTIGMAKHNPNQITDPAVPENRVMQALEGRGYSVLQPVICHQILQGQKTCGFSATRPETTAPYSRIEMLHLASYINGKMHFFVMSNYVSTFPIALPMFENMLATFREPPR